MTTQVLVRARPLFRSAPSHLFPGLVQPRVLATYGGLGVGSCSRTYASASLTPQAQAQASTSGEYAAKSEASSRGGPSTALQPQVRQSEEESGITQRVVGVEDKLSEGLHFHDTRGGATTDKILTDLNGAGSWTLFNPIYTEKELDGVQIVYRPTVTLSDKLAHGSVKLTRRIFDWVTGYKALPIPQETLDMRPLPIEQLRKDGMLLSDKMWMSRIIVLESIAGVPGMVAGTLRHLRSLRRLRRDGGWIHTLLEEAENERMHLLTFMTIAQPGWFLRATILAAQGLMYNLLFATYLISPKTAHRFVAALEEEAVKT